MTQVAEAERLILDHMPRAATERVPLADAVGRTLAEGVEADRDHPPFDRVMMDGIAIAYRDFDAGIRQFRAAGVQAAGTPPLTLDGRGDCARVMTGAWLPSGTDTVIPVERVIVERETVTVRDGAEVQPRQFVHTRGSDRPTGSRLLSPGVRLGAPQIAVLASAGAAQVTVAKIPSVAVISTGDELVDVDEPIAPHQIRSSNDRAIDAAVRIHHLGRVTRARLPDDAAVLLEQIERLHASHDVLILSGGVSMGDFDHVPAVLERLGARVVFHRIDQKPGRPMWFGVSAAGKPLFALPGNPVSALVCTARYVLPALRASEGLAAFTGEHAVLTATVEMPRGLAYFMPVVIEPNEHGVLQAHPRPTNTSGDFITLAGTDGFVELPQGAAAYPPGHVAKLFRW